MRIVGIILICIGLLTLALPYVTFTKQEKVIDIGPYPRRQSQLFEGGRDLG